MSESASPARHEAPGMGTRGVVMAVAALFSLVVIAMVAVAVLLELSMGDVSDPPALVPQFPAPQLQIDPQSELADVERRAHARLHEGAAMPINRAMDIIAKRGPNAYAPLVSSDSQRESPQ